MNHREKLKLARRMADSDKSLWEVDSRGNRHRKKQKGVFTGEEWDKHRQGIERKVKNQEFQAKKRKEEKLKIKSKHE